MKTLPTIFALTVLVLLLISCLKPEQVSIIPAIEFKEYVMYGKDSAEISIKFKDGDGDIGLNDSDTLPPFDISSPFYYNLYLIYYYKGTDELFHRYFNIPNQDSLAFKYRITDITPTGQNKILDGELSVSLFAPIYIQGHKTVKFDIYIYDRAQNKSNVVSTNEIVVP